MKYIFFILLLPFAASSQSLKSSGQFGLAHAKVNGVKKIMLQKSSGLGMETWIGKDLYLSIVVGTASIEFDLIDFKNERSYYKQKYFFIQPGIKKYYPISRRSFTSIELGPAVFYRYKTIVNDSANTYSIKHKDVSLALATAFSFSTIISSQWTFELGLSKQDDILSKKGYEKIKRSGISLTLHRKI